MKTTIHTILILFLQLGAVGFGFAECGPARMWAWPRTSTILPNQQIVINGKAGGEPVSKVIGTKYPVFLVSYTERVEMVVVETYMSQAHASQVLLRPKTKLIAGRVYRLEVEDLEGGEFISRYDTKKQQELPIDWFVSGAVDTKPPLWASAPLELEKYYHAYGCGPDFGVVFQAMCHESEPKLVKVELKGLHSEEWTTYYLEVRDDKINIGRSMCGGVFSLLEEKEFEVKFTLVDGAGNSSPYPGPAIRFTRPPEMDQY